MTISTKRWSAAEVMLNEPIPPQLLQVLTEALSGAAGLWPALAKPMVCPKAIDITSEYAQHPMLYIS
jgi:hypothetical protein